MSSPLVWLKAVALLLALLLGPAALVMIVCAVTWPGWVLGASLGLIGTGPVLWWIGDERCSSAALWAGKSFPWLGSLGLAWVFWVAPSGLTPECTAIHSRYSGGGWHFDRFALGNLVPEIDQIHLGYAAALAVDPLFSRAQKRELAAITDAIYDDMARDENFAACGSALPAIYDELRFTEFRRGHYFHYIPARVDRMKPSPALVFLHGSGGNFKACVWLLSKVADQVGCTVIAPTFGLGNWEKRGAYDAITDAIRDASKHAVIDVDQIHLMGLSNGGIGVCLAESGPGPRFRSLIFLSSVFHQRIQPEKLGARFAGRPALILSGGSDDRVPWEYVAGNASRLEKAGMHITTRCYDGEDHFLFFRRREEVLGEIQKWLEKQR